MALSCRFDRVLGFAAVEVRARRLDRVPDVVGLEVRAGRLRGRPAHQRVVGRVRGESHAAQLGVVVDDLVKRDGDPRRIRPAHQAGGGWVGLKPEVGQGDDLVIRDGGLRDGDPGVGHVRRVGLRLIDLLGE